MKFDCLYAGKSYEIYKDSVENITIKNMGNIPTTFKWKNISNHFMDAIFEPSEGVIEPKTNLPIKFTLTPKLGGPFHEIFPVEIDGIEI